MSNLTFLKSSLSLLAWESSQNGLKLGFGVLLTTFHKPDKRIFPWGEFARHEANLLGFLCLYGLDRGDIFSRMVLCHDSYVFMNVNKKKIYSE